jgi:hypothetical protein
MGRDGQKIRVDEMKKALILTVILVGILGFLSQGSGAERKSPRDLMIIGRDYNPWEDVSNHPVSLGLGTWRNDELGNKLMGYGSAAFLTYKDVIRIEAGVCGTWDQNSGWVEIAMLTGVSTLINDHIVFGVWMSPFWGLDKRFPDDPWGIMMGYAF